MRHSRFLIPVLAVVAAGTFVSGCASSPSGTSGSDASQQSAPRRRTNPNLITSEELAVVENGSAYDAIQRLRPNFLQTRGATSLGGSGGGGIVVYMDSNKLGSVSQLQQIPITEVKEIRYLSASEATQRFGTNHTQGAIIVTHK